MQESGLGLLQSPGRIPTLVSLMSWMLEQNTGHENLDKERLILTHGFTHGRLVSRQECGGRDTWQKKKVLSSR